MMDSNFLRQYVNSVKAKAPAGAKAMAATRKAKAGNAVRAMKK